MGVWKPFGSPEATKLIPHPVRDKGCIYHENLETEGGVETMPSICLRTVLVFSGWFHWNLSLLEVFVPGG